MFVKELQKQEWVRDYQQSGLATQDHYGVIMLSRLPCKMAFHPLPTRMGRQLLTAEINDGGGDDILVVGTVHLESLDSPDWREQQLSAAADVLKGSETSLLVGDFNFCSERSWAEGRRLQREGRADDSPLENDVLKRKLPEHKDVWADLRPTEKGYTFDSTRNGVIRQYEQMRYDRVMARLQKGWRASSIQMIGTQPIHGSEEWLRP